MRSIASYRDSSFELLRLILMMMIVIHHCIVHGLGLSSLGSKCGILLVTDSQMGIAFGINAFCICAVNCFILISGYFAINVSAKRFINLILSLLFYTIIFVEVPYAFEGNWKVMVERCLFLSHSPYWFVIDYLFLMVFAPMLNLGFDKFSTHQRKVILIGLLIISCYFGFIWSHTANKNGYTILQFITMYCVGREIAISRYKLSVKKSIILYIGGSILLSFVGYICWKTGKNELAWRTTYYNDPLLVISSFGLFMLFKKITFHSIIINSLARSAFGIYLFQSSPLIGSKMYEWLQQHNVEFGSYVFFVILIISILVTIVSIIIDQMRLRFLNVMSPLSLKLYNKVKHCIYY